MRVPGTGTTVAEVLMRQWGFNFAPSPKATLAGELKRKLLRDFEAHHPRGVRDGHYGKELLAWWIDERAARQVLDDEP